jgi:hypothetical protein
MNENDSERYLADPAGNNPPKDGETGWEFPVQVTPRNDGEYNIAAAREKSVDVATREKGHTYATISSQIIMMYPLNFLLPLLVSLNALMQTKTAKPN